MNTRAFWNRVKALIKKKGLTQEETAKACRIKFSTFRNWMSVPVIPPVSDAYKLARYLGVSLEFLISGKGPDKISETNEEVITLLRKAEEKLMEIRRAVP